MPTFDLQGRVLIYFAGYREHVGMYPVIGAVAEALEEELRPFKSGKGNGAVRRWTSRFRPIWSDASFWRELGR